MRFFKKLLDTLGLGRQEEIVAARPQVLVVNESAHFTTKQHEGIVIVRALSGIDEQFREDFRLHMDRLFANGVNEFIVDIGATRIDPLSLGYCIEWKTRCVRRDGELVILTSSEADKSLVDHGRSIVMTPWCLPEAFMSEAEALERLEDLRAARSQAASRRKR